MGSQTAPAARTKPPPAKQRVLGTVTSPRSQCESLYQSAPSPSVCADTQPNSVCVCYQWCQDVRGAVYQVCLWTLPPEVRVLHRVVGASDHCDSDRRQCVAVLPEN